MPTELNRFTTTPRKISREGELQWGSERGWERDIDQLDRVTIEDGVISPDTAPPLPTNGLLIHWMFNESTGENTAHDSSKNNNTGSISGAIPGQPGRDGKHAYEFTGDSDYVSAGTDLLSGAQSLTVAAWINPQSFNYADDGHFSNSAQLIGKQGQNGDDNFTLSLLRTGSIGFYLDNGDTANLVGGSISTGTWSFVLGVYDGSTGDVRLQVNDSIVDSTSLGTGTTVSNPNPLGVGAAPNQNFSGNWFAFDGRIQDVFMYETALSVSESHNLYEAMR